MKKTTFLLLISSLASTLNVAALTVDPAAVLQKKSTEKQLLKDLNLLKNIKGEHLGAEKIANPLYVLALKMKGIDPVPFFKKAIQNNNLLREAVFHTDYSSTQAIEDLEKLNLQELETGSDLDAKFVELLETEHFINVKKGLRLVILALQQFAVKKNYVNPLDGGKPNTQGKVFIATVSAIIGHTFKRYGLLQDSTILAILQSLYQGNKGIENALQAIETDWNNPAKAMRMLLEVRALSSDICFDVAAVREMGHELAESGRTAEMFYAECMDRLERLNRPKAAVAKQAAPEDSVELNKSGVDLEATAKTADEQPAFDEELVNIKGL